MTTNRPEVVAWHTPTTRDTLPVVALNDRSQRGEPLIRLSDYERLQTECEKLRTLLRHAQPIIRAHAEASHMLEGFRPKRNQWDELVEAIDAATRETSRAND